MAVVVQDRLWLGVLMKEAAGGLVREEKIFVDESHSGKH
jgi:hypothetical protein